MWLILVISLLVVKMTGSWWTGFVSFIFFSVISGQVKFHDNSALGSDDPKNSGAFAPEATLQVDLCKSYEILGVSPLATNDEVKCAYRKLAMRYHPDRNSAPNAAEQFREINEAFNLIKTVRGI